MYKIIIYNCVVLAEWLRRWTANPLGIPRAGSNPVDDVNIFNNFCLNSLVLGRGQFGRVVKAMDLKSIGVSPRGFESRS